MVKARLCSAFMVLVLVVSLVLMAPPFVREARAVAVLTSISPSTGPVGTSVTVTGTVAAMAVYEIRWDTAAGTLLYTGTSGASGAVNINVAIPDAPSGGHRIYLVDLSDASNAFRTFTVTPAIEISPSSGYRNAAVSVTGAGFAASETGIKVTWDGNDLASAGPADADGGWTKTITVPSDSPGVHYIGAYGDTTTAAAVPQMEFALLVVVGLTINPTSGPAGTVVTVRGTRFAPGETGIQVLWDGVDGYPIATVPAVITADGTGAWTATFVVPASTPEDHIVDARGPTTSYTWVTDATFRVTRDLWLTSLTPNTGPVGASVTVTGRVVAGASYYIRWDDPVTGEILARGASATGAVSKVVTIPVGASDVGHKVYLVDLSEPADESPPSASLPFIITPAIAIGADSGKAGDMISVTGTGFAASETGVKVTWDGADLVAAGAASATGGWAKTITIPSDAGRPHQVGAYGDVTRPVDVPDVDFLVLRNLAVSPASGPVGTTVTVSGTGFGYEETGIQVLWDGAGAGGYPLRTDINASPLGAWNITLVVPASVAGNHIVDARGTATTQAMVPDAVFTVTRDVSISPASYYMGTSVTVTGRGYAASSPITITYDGVPVVTTPPVVTSTSVGNVSAVFVVPTSATGTHLVMVSDPFGSASATFTTTSSIASSVASGQVGTQNTVTGTGFPPGSVVSLTYDGSPVATTPAAVTADPSGAFTLTFAVPESQRGVHTIRVSSGAIFLTTTFTVSPVLSVNPTSAAAGTPVTVSGRGFGAGAAVTVSLNGSIMTMEPAPPIASALGSFTASFVLPAGLRGAYAVVASDGVGSAEAMVSITPRVTLGSTTAKVGDKLTAVGTGFAAGAAISVTVDGAAATVDPSPLVADASGEFTVQVTVPAGALGSHTVSFSDAIQSVSATYSLAPTLSLSPSAGNVGSAVSLVGTGFAAGRPVSVTYDGSPIATKPTPLSSTAQGGLQAMVTIPPGKAGRHIIVVSDGSGGVLEVAFTVESVPPPAPVPTKPANGSRIGTFGAQSPAFTWSAVSSPGGVAYTLQVSMQPGFTSLVLEKSGLKPTSYTVEKALGVGYYYWRVKATDLVSNESTWGQTFTFTVGLLPAWMPLWLFIVLAIVVVGLIAGVVYFLRSSRRE